MSCKSHKNKSHDYDRKYVLNNDVVKQYKVAYDILDEKKEKICFMKNLAIPCNLAAELQKISLLRSSFTVCITFNT